MAVVDTSPELLAPELEALVCASLSRVIGESTGWRAQTHPLGRVMVGLAGLSFRTADAEIAAPFPHIASTRVPNGRTAFNRIKASRGLTRRDVDRLWSDAQDEMGVYAALPREIIAEFFPPVIWCVAVEIIDWGPHGTNERLRRFLKQEARRTTQQGKNGLTLGSLANLEKAYRKYAATLRDLAEAGDPYLRDRKWLESSKSLDLRAMAARTSNGHRPAPPLRSVRSSLTELEREVASKRGRSDRKERSLRALRDLAFISVLTATASREGALIYDDNDGPMRVKQFDPFHKCPDGTIEPALLLYIEKTKSRSPVPRWKGLPADVAGNLIEYLEFANLADDPEAPMWISFWDSGIPGNPDKARPLTIAGAASIVRRFLAGYSPHQYRHLASQLGKQAGYDYVAERKEQYGSIDPGDIAAALADQAIKGDPLGYQDQKSEPGRERWARVASHGIWDHLRGDRGARTGPDRERVSEAERRLEEAIAAYEIAEGAVSTQRTRRREVGERAARMRSSASASRDDAFDLIMDLILIGTDLDDAIDERDRRDRDRVAAEVELHDARDARIVLPDDAPEELEDEIASDDGSGQGLQLCEPLYMRDWVSVKEAAAAFGVEDVTMRRWFNGKLPYPDGDPRNAWDAANPPIQELSPRKRRLIVTELNPRRVAPTIMSRLNELRKHPASR